MQKHARLQLSGGTGKSSNQDSKMVYSRMPSQITDSVMPDTTEPSIRLHRRLI